MDILAENDDRIYGAVTIDRAAGFVSPFSGHLFPCLIWDHEGRFVDVERAAVAKALLEAGCRYAVCGGERCEAWHDAVDEEFVAEHLDDPEETQNAAHVMTTWHSGETPDEVAFFFVLNTNFDDHDFRRYLVLHVGSGPAKAHVDAAVRKYALGKEAV
jgi:hypothetical protein